MRTLTLLPVVLVTVGMLGGPSRANERADGAPAPRDLAALERAWHGCVRAAYARQPAGQSRAGAQRNVLDECQDHEDALVAATMAEQDAQDAAARAAGLPLTARAGAWAASVVAYVVDPVTTWLRVRRR